MRRIKDCTLIVIDTLNPGAAISSIRKSMAQCEFDEVILFTNIDLKLDGIKVVLIPIINSKDEYSEFILKLAWRDIMTDFVLVTQHDSWVLNGDCFDERLYNYDYAGALWIENDGLANGNGGLSWRSLKLMEAVAMDDHINATSPEDVAICRVYRRYLEKNYDMKWAPDEICEAFSFELRAPYQQTFGFHGFFHEPYRKMVVIKRLDAMGDAISVEPVLEYFHRKGYRVVFETLPQFETLFHNHYFPLLFPHQIDSRVLATAKYYDLTMSYESNPKQLHLDSYYDFCEVPKEERIIRNPKLNFVATPEIKIFKQKYVVIHIDRRPSTPHRNVEGIVWWKITDYLKSKGYLVVQIGKNEAIELDAIQMNTIAEPMLAYVISGCDLFLGADSGPSHIAVATGRKCVLFFGSVFPWYIHADPANIRAIHNHDERQSCRTPFCWHNSITQTGQDCVENKYEPPCCKFSTEQVKNAINELI